jgi:hypothetical protein
MQPDTTNQIFDMGELKKSFGPNSANAKILLYTSPFFILIGLVLMGRLLVAGISMFLIAVLLFLGSRAQLRAKADFYARGVVAKDWMGRSHSFHWQDVTGVYEFIGYDTRTGYVRSRVYWVHLKDGRKVKFDMAYEDIRAIGHTLLSETGKTFLSQSLEQYKAGQTIPFGDKIGINLHGLVSGKETLDWKDVSEILIDRTGDLIIRKTDQRMPWKYILHPKIANFPTFRALVHGVVKGTPAESKLKDPIFEQAQKRQADQSKAAVGNIGTVSAAVGYDIRELMMEGYDLKEIHRVASGEITLEQLRQARPKAKKKT